MTDKHALDTIKQKVAEFFAGEEFLIGNDLHVKCLAAKLLSYLSDIDEGWEVFLDYNYQYQSAYKTTADFDTISLFPMDAVKLPVKQTKIRLYPQIAIRREGQNFVAIEIHKSTSRVSPKLTVDKLTTLTNRESPIHYQYGLNVQLATGKAYQKNTSIQVHKVNEYVATFDFN